jgi:tetratricopeptide (TPR) repeat protein
MTRYTLLLWFTLAGAAQTYEQLFEDARMLSGKGEYARAAQKYEAALRIRPNAPEALNNVGVVYYLAGRFEYAAAVLGAALRVQPDLMPANLMRGLSLVQLGRFSEAGEPLERVLRRDEANRDALLGLASAKVGLGQLQEAAALYRQQTRRTPEDADAWHGLALCLERAAEAESRKLYSVPEGRAYAKRFLGEYWLERGQRNLAEEALSEAAAIDPQQPGLQELLHVLRTRQSGDRFDVAAVASNAPAAYREAKQLARLSREAFEKFVAIAPESWQAQLFLGDVSRQRREFEQAIAH